MKGETNITEKLQLSIFDLQEDVLESEVSVNNEESIQDEVIQFEVNDRVRAIMPEYKLNDVESVFYLENLLGKRGIVIKVLEYQNLQYEVDFGDKRISIIYHDELILGWGN